MSQPPSGGAAPEGQPGPADPAAVPAAPAAAPLEPSASAPGAPQQPTGADAPAPPGQAVGEQAAAATQSTVGARHLLWRAKKSSKPIVALWLTPTEDGCDLNTDVYPVKSLRVDPIQAGPYHFRRAADAQAFAQEAARALMHLGCEIVEDERPQQPEPGSLGASLRLAPPKSA